MLQPNRKSAKHITRLHSAFVLAAIGSLVGAGCDERVDEPALREAPVYISPIELVPETCLESVKLVFHHDDGSSEVSDQVGDLAELTRPGDLVELFFKWAPGCGAEYDRRLTFASYIGVGTNGAKAPLKAYDVHTARFDDAGGSLHVRVPDCAYELHLAFGEPLAAFGADVSSLAGKGRWISRAKGGKAECTGVPAFAIDRFDTEGRGWGDAPFDAQFGWQIDHKAGEALTCELDLDADGTADQIVKPCPVTSAGLDALPSRLYVTPGATRPELVVRAGERRMWASTTVYANRLEFKDNVRFPEEVKGFIDIDLAIEPNGEAGEVVLGYQTADAVPTIDVGDVIVGKTFAREYMLTATEVTQDGSKLIVHGTFADVADTVAGGFYGIRDFVVDTSKAHCVEDCLGTVTPVDQLPGQGGVVNELFDSEVMMLDGDNGETKKGVKFTYTIPGGKGEIEIDSGVVINNFELSFDLWEGPTCDMDVKAVFEGVFSGVAGMDETIKLGRVPVAALPIGLPIVLYLQPRVVFETAFKATIKIGAEAPARLKKSESGFEGDVEVVVTGDAEVTGGAEVSGESRVTLLGALTAYLGPIEGPYVAPYMGAGYRVTVATDCELCAAIFVDGGVELGWFMSWFNEPLFDPLKFTLAERELVKICEQLPLPIPACEPDPEPPGGSGGGCWGDVHVVSHDGLLYDFQAGGEFVLMRTTSGAPIEVQGRLSPMGDNLAVSVTTGVVTKVGEERVALHTDREHTLYVDGVSTALASGAAHTLLAGEITRDGDVYTILYPTGERMTVKVVVVPGGQSHLNVAMDHLMVERFDAVEGILGDNDGNPHNDFNMGGQTFLPQPLSLVELHGVPGQPDEPGSFAHRWRVPLGASLFDYDADESAATYRAAPYSVMPSGSQPAEAPHAAMAQALCAACPEDLRDTCMLDVGYTGDEEFAAACQELPVQPASTTIPGDGPVIVAPRYGATLDCAAGGNEFVFVAPGAADLDEMPTVERFILMVDGWWANDGHYNVTWLDTTEGHTGFEPQLTCEPIGDGSWGECTLRLVDGLPPCDPLGLPATEWTFTVSRMDGDEVVYSVTSSFAPPTPIGG